MQRDSIHKPAHAENTPPFPTSGDNFTQAVSLDYCPDPISLLQALDFLDDYQAALAVFEAELQRTGTL